MRQVANLAWVLLWGSTLCAQAADKIEQEPNSWVKRSPLPTAPVSPSLGYEGSFGYDPRTQLVLRWAGHNQGGGGEQNAEMWTFSPLTAKWSLKEPNLAPPGVCCAQQNLFDPSVDRFVRFGAFSGNHGWHWFRENYLNNTSVWTYNLADNTWRDQRPAPTVRTGPLRCASWDSTQQVCVVFGGEGIQEGTLVYDAYTNTWTRMHPKKQPEFRSGGNQAYDPVHKKHVLFGSQFIDDPHTWAYDLRKNEWLDLKPANQPPTNKNDPVLAYDENSGLVLAQLRIPDKLDKEEVLEAHLETWAFDLGKNQWTALKPKNEPAGRGSRRRMMVALPDLNVLLMENYINPAERVQGVDREQQIWTYRHSATRTSTLPEPPTNLRVQVSKEANTLSWQASTSPESAEYVVYRGEGDKPWLVDYHELATVPANTTRYVDTKTKPGQLGYYYVRTKSKAGTLSKDSLKVRAQPKLIEEIVVSVVSAKEVELRWQPAPEHEGVAEYEVERAVVEVFTEDQIHRLKKDTAPLDQPSIGAIEKIGPFEKQATIRGTSWTDKKLDLNVPVQVTGEPVYQHRFRADQLDAQGKAYRYAVYAYRIRARNSLGILSGPSAYHLTVPAGPQWLFSKEVEATCQLKWQANLEKGIKGYRVYRMEGPKINGPGQPVTRLTANLVTEPRFTDEKATKETKRYWVVAVDALGQEGFTSAPTWHYRQYRSYYLPFTGEWHQ